MEPQASILVVDDEIDLLENIELALEAEGYRVLTATDGSEALAILESHPVDLILADIAMPTMNGYQLFERIQQHPAWVPIPFIFLTARTLDSDVRYGKALGVDDYLLKPIRVNDLVAVVRGKLRRAHQLSQAVTRPPAREAGEVRVGPLEINLAEHRVWLHDQILPLSAREFISLHCLVQAQGGVVSPQAIIRQTHDLETDPVEAGNLLRPLIFSLRRKMEQVNPGEGDLIENVRGVGYRLLVTEP